MPLRKTVLRTLLFAFAMSAGAAAIGAQAVHGTVVLGDSATAARAVIVLATDERGATVSRTLTGERGEFTLALPAAGRFGLQVLRIGFRPTLVPPIAVEARTTASVRIVLNAAAVPLAAVNVRAQDECRVNPDSGLMVARVWDEARKAILTSQLSAEGAPLYAEWIAYDRTLEASGRIVREQHVHTSRNQTTHAFTSLPAEQLASKGYVVSDTVETMFYAPDAEVLMSSSFAATHCFKLVPAPRDRPGLIGVGFQPVRERENVHDITGTFWVDRATSELRSLEFKYTNLPPVVEAAVAGGDVEFLRLSDGSWLVNQWSVRLPMLGVPERINERSSRFSVNVTKATVGAIQVSGGQVTAVLRNEAPQYRANGPRLALQVISRDSLLPAAGSMLALAGTDYVATADAYGRFALSPVLEGHYRARVQSWLMDSLGLGPVERDIEVRADAHVDSLALPTAREALVKMCPSDSVRHGEGMLRGSARDERGRALTQAAVTVTWQRSFADVGDKPTIHEETLGVLTDDAGLWHVCGVPRGIALNTRVISDSGADFHSAMLAEDQAFGAVNLIARRGEEGTNAGPATTRALVELAVYGTGGAPLPGATLDITVPGGATRTVTTGTSGRALLPDVAPGVLRVRARRIGFKPGQLAIAVEAGRNTVPILLSDVAMPALDTVRIVGNKAANTANTRLSEFDRRHMNHEATTSFSREDIVKRNVVDTWQLFNNVPSVRYIPDGESLIAVSNRGLKVNRDGSLPCVMTIMVDGVVMQGDHFLKDAMGMPILGSAAYDLTRLPPPEDLYGIEVFAGGADIPSKYGGMSGKDRSCGMIAFWTR